MEEQQEVLLEQLEAEGREIARYRKSLLSIISSGKKINSSRLAILCEHLNKHISYFDKLSAELSTLEATG